MNNEEILDQILLFLCIVNRYICLLIKYFSFYLCIIFMYIVYFILIIFTAQSERAKREMFPVITI